MLQKLSKASGGTILIIQTKSKKDFKSKISGFVSESIFSSKFAVIRNYNKSMSSFLQALQEKLREKLEVTCAHTSLTETARKYNIAVDEDNKDCVEGKKLMSELYAAIEYSSTNLKDLVPLQSKRLWCEWASMDKEQF